MAQRENKPMLLDIGAVWCHWCHVMDRESYDDPEIAAIVNEHFVAVKVDRDERPDIDSRYQAAVQAVSGQGGWPLTAFLTPDGKPFYGGTYFPPSDGYGRPSFRRVLLSIANAYKEKHGDVVEQAQMVESAIAQSESFAGEGWTVSAVVIHAIQDSALKMFDPQHGGFGQAPKFPHPSALDLLIERYARGEASLRRTAEGGRPHTNDRPRQSTAQSDRHYPGAHGPRGRLRPTGRRISSLLGGRALGGAALREDVLRQLRTAEELRARLSGDGQSEFFADVARDIIRWMDEWLSDREHGGFYASQDADISMDDDGDYFTWTLDEARAVLTEEEAQVAALHYDINEVGEMHHNPAKNVLYVRASVEEIGKRMNLRAGAREDLLASAKKKMYAARLQRPTPYVDKTVYVGWNSLCVSAYLEAARVLESGWRRGSSRCGRWIACWRSVEAIVWRTSAGEAPSAQRSCCMWWLTPIRMRSIARSPGLLDDYAFTGFGLSRRVRGDRGSELLQVCARDRRRDDCAFLRCDVGRILRQRTSWRRARASACWRRGASRCRTRRRRREIRWRRSR